jgi:hypothetical protein
MYYVTHVINYQSYKKSCVSPSGLYDLHPSDSTNIIKLRQIEKRREHYIRGAFYGSN